MKKSLSLILSLMLLCCICLPGCAEQTVAYQIGDTVNDFTVVTTDGDELSLYGLLEEYQAVVLNFYFNDCQYCVAETPCLEEAYRLYRDQLVVLGLSVRDDLEDVASFKEKYGIEYPMASVAADLVSWMSAFDLNGYPTSVVIDRFGVYCCQFGTQFFTRNFLNVFDAFTEDQYTESKLDYQAPAITLSDLGGGSDLPDDAVEFSVTGEGMKYYKVVDEEDEEWIDVDSVIAYVVPDRDTGIIAKIRCGNGVSIDSLLLYDPMSGTMSPGQVTFDGKDGFSWEILLLEPGDISMVEIYDRSKEKVVAAGYAMTAAVADTVMESLAEVNEPANEPTETFSTLMRFTCVDDSGAPVAGVMFTLCDDSSCLMMQSDGNGFCEYDGTSVYYDVHVLRAPEGLQYAGEADMRAYPGGEYVLPFSAQ